VKSIVWGLGYTIEKRKPEQQITKRDQWGKDPFLDMAMLLESVPEPLILDVGAHHGHVARKFREVLPRSRLFAFEPFPDSFKTLQENVKNDTRISVFPFGFADRPGIRSLTDNQFSATNSLLETDPRGHDVWGPNVLNTRETIEAFFDTLDDFAEMEVRGGIDILKLDCQGAEPLVMRGAKKLLKNRQIRVVYTEIITLPTYVDQLRFYEAIRFFEGCGLNLFNLYDLSLTPSGVLRQVDAIFVRSPK
jgi:FkbM family methyltransferase